MSKTYCTQHKVTLPDLLVKGKGKFTAALGIGGYPGTHGADLMTFGGNRGKSQLLSDSSGITAKLHILKFSCFIWKQV